MNPGAGSTFLLSASCGLVALALSTAACAQTGGPSVAATTSDETMPTAGADVEIDAIVAAKRPALPYPEQGETYTACGVTPDLIDVEKFPAEETSTQTVDRDWVARNEPSTVLFRWIQGDDLHRDYQGSPGTVGGIGWCSGTMISATHILTAAHCFEPSRGGIDPATGKKEHRTPYRAVGDERVPFGRDDIATKLLFIEFNYQWSPVSLEPDGMSEKKFRAQIVRLAESGFSNTSDRLDYAIVEIEPFDRAKHEHEYPPAKILEQSVSTGAPIGIIQHPNGEPKKVESGLLLRASRTGRYLYYADIDTEGGASGSGILDADGRLIGVHVIGYCDKDSEELTGGESDEVIARRSNIGVSIQAIHAKSPIINSLMQP